MRVGDNIQFRDPKLADAIRTLWRQQLFEDITFKVVNKVGKKVYLDIQLVALLKQVNTGDRTEEGWKDDIEELDLRAGKVVNENLKVMSRNKIKKYFLKGYLNEAVEVLEKVILPIITR